MARFELFSALHLGSILVFGFLWTLFALTGRRLRGTPRQQAWRGTVAGFVLLSWLFANGVQLLPAHFRADVVLPLQACDIAGVVAVMALWRPGRWSGVLLHFWGLGFALQAILTPELLYGPQHIDYWTFWLPHANLFGAACYGLAVEGYRPSFRDALRAFVWALVYLALILPFDLLTGFNYGYVGPAKPLNPSLLDWLGPWPWRIGVMALLTVSVFLLLALPWGVQNPRKTSL